jgi:hypothetical protein
LELGSALDTELGIGFVGAVEARVAKRRVVAVMGRMVNCIFPWGFLGGGKIGFD